MRVDISTPRASNGNFGDVTSILKDRPPRRNQFLRSKRCKVMVVIGIILIVVVIALIVSTYAVAFTVTKSSTTTATTVRTPIYQIITQSSDSVVAIYNTTAGGNSLISSVGNGFGNFLSGHNATAAIDFTETTTYLIFGYVGLNSANISVGMGVHTEPTIGASIVNAIKFQTGNESADRDPLTITLEGSNQSGSNLYIGSAWTLLYDGPTGLAPFSSTRLAWGDPQNISNTQSYTAYRVLVTSLRGVENCTEFAEMHLYTIV